MLNKKRLAMMAVAASMMLPTNLAYLSVATPVTVLAADVDVTEDNSLGEQVDIEDSEGNTKSYLYIKESGSYKLGDDITLDYPLVIKSTEEKAASLEVNIDLNGHILTSKAALSVTVGAGNTLNITDSSSESSGKIKSTVPSSTTVDSQILNLSEGSTLLVDGVDIEGNEGNNGDYAVCVGPNITNFTITLKNLSISNLIGGLGINGLVKEGTPPSEIGLENVQITTPVIGIYQAGPAKTTLDRNCSITSDNMGIEVRAGDLIVNGATITSNAKSAPFITPKGSGSTADNIGIAMIPHTPGNNIAVTLNGGKIEAPLAVAIADPHTNPDLNDVIGSNLKGKKPESVTLSLGETLPTLTSTQFKDTEDKSIAVAYTVPLKKAVEGLDPSITTQLVTFDVNNKVGTSGYPFVATVDNRADLGITGIVTVKDDTYVLLTIEDGELVPNYESLELDFKNGEGNEIDPKPEKDTDYTLEVTAEEVGETSGTVKVKAKDDSELLQGEKELTVKVVGDLNGAEATFDPNSYPVDELSELDQLPIPTVTFNETALEAGEDKDFTVSYSFEATPTEESGDGEGEETEDPQEITDLAALQEIDTAGTVTATITGIGNYTNTITATFEITNQDPKTEIDLAGYDLTVETPIEIKLPESGTLTINDIDLNTLGLKLTKDGADPVSITSDNFKVTDVIGDAGANLNAADVTGTMTIKVLENPTDTIIGAKETGYTAPFKIVGDTVGEKTPLAVQFALADGTQVDDLVPLEEGVTEVSVDDLIKNLQTINSKGKKYHFVGEPVAISETDFTEEIKGSDNKVQYKAKVVTLGENTGSEQWTPANDDVVILVNYKTADADAKNKTVKFKGSDVVDNAIPAATINNELIGYITAGSANLSKYDVIGYTDADGSSNPKGLIYTPTDEATLTVTSASIQNDKTVTITVGNITLENIPVSNIVQTAEGTTTLTPEIAPEKLVELLNTSEENSQPKSEAKPAPNYTYFTTQGFEEDVTTNTDLSDCAQIKVEVKPESAIGLNFVKATAQSSQIRTVSQESHYEDSLTSETKYVTLRSIGGDDKMVTGDELTKANVLPANTELDGDPNLDFTQNASLDDINSETGYIEKEVMIKDKTGGTTDPGVTPPGNGGTSSNKKPKPKPEEPTTPVVGTPTTMYRLYNKLTGEHLYTIDKNERDNLLTSDTWKDEGQGWIAPSVSDYPVYRLLNPNNGDHHYTTDKNEFDTLPTYGWVAEGVAFFSADKNNTENVILHRLYNPNATGAGSHHYTADTNERDTLVAQGWTYEGTAWAGLPANK